MPRDFQQLFVEADALYERLWALFQAEYARVWRAQRCGSNERLPHRLDALQRRARVRSLRRSRFALIQHLERQAAARAFTFVDEVGDADPDAILGYDFKRGE